MNKSFKNKRLIFPENEQKLFLERSQKKLKLNNFEFAEKLGVHPRTLYDWKREKFSISLEAVKKIEEITNIKRSECAVMRDRFAHTSQAGKIGGKNNYIKNGNIGGEPKYRKKKWREWWNREGKNLKLDILQPKKINKPCKCAELAEFIGILLGDGNLNTYQVSVTLDKKEIEYCKFVSNLCQKLFGIKPSIRTDQKKSATSIVISRVELVLFLIKLGMKKGNKITNQVDIPQWIKQNKKFRVSCLRGLIDTDGSIIKHTYSSKNKIYTYNTTSY